MFEQLSEWLAELEYLPHSKMTLERRITYDPIDPDFMLVIEVIVPDAYDPKKLIPVKVQHLIGKESYWQEYNQPKIQFLDMVKHIILELACHEAMEWLRVRETGRPLFDPHSN